MNNLEEQLALNAELNKNRPPEEHLPEDIKGFIKRELVKVSEQLKRCESFPSEYKNAAIDLFKKQQEKLIEWLKDVENSLDK